MASAFGRVDNSFSPLLLAPPSSRVTALSSPPLFGEVGTSKTPGPFATASQSADTVMVGSLRIAAAHHLPHVLSMSEV